MWFVCQQHKLMANFAATQAWREQPGLQAEPSPAMGQIAELKLKSIFSSSDSTLTRGEIPATACPAGRKFLSYSWPGSVTVLLQTWRWEPGCTGSGCGSPQCPPVVPAWPALRAPPLSARPFLPETSWCPAAGGRARAVRSICFQKSS